jgi:hypothetical protein
MSATLSWPSRCLPERNFLGFSLVDQIRLVVPSVLNHKPLISWADSPDRMGRFCRDRTTRISPIRPPGRPFSAS